MNSAAKLRTAAGAGRRAATHPRRAQRGVTLVEVMATTAITAIILGMAAPSYVDMMRVNKARSEAQQFSALLIEARNEAMKRNVPVLVCPSSGAATCLASPTASSWAGRTIVCYDVDGNDACDSSTTALPNPIRVRSRVDSAVVLTGPTAAVRFNGMGAVTGSTSFQLSTGAGASQSSTISVAATGTVRAY
jgi:type IV fimbrial biogenesis protein FimT